MVWKKRHACSLSRRAAGSGVRATLRAPRRDGGGGNREAGGHRAACPRGRPAGPSQSPGKVATGRGPLRGGEAGGGTTRDQLLGREGDAGGAGQPRPPPRQPPRRPGPPIPSAAGPSQGRPGFASGGLGRARSPGRPSGEQSPRPVPGIKRCRAEGRRERLGSAVCGSARRLRGDAGPRGRCSPAPRFAAAAAARTRSPARSRCAAAQHPPGRAHAAVGGGIGSVPENSPQP